MSRTKIYWQEQKFTGARFVTIKYYTETMKMFCARVDGHNLHTELNDRWCCLLEQKKNWSPQTFRLCIQQELKYMLN